LRDNEILKILSNVKGRRPAVYAFWKLVNIAEGKEVF
jgi:hypothetical protein